MPPIKWLKDDPANRPADGVDCTKENVQDEPIGLSAIAMARVREIQEKCGTVVAVLLMEAAGT